MIKKIFNLKFFDYDKNISYLGSWKYNSFRTKLNIHKILPFNFEAFKHDKRYSLLFRTKLNLFMMLVYKLIIDLFFLCDCIVESFKKPLNLPLRLVFAVFCFCVVIVFTPIYYFRYRKKN